MPGSRAGSAFGLVCAALWALPGCTGDECDRDGDGWTKGPRLDDDGERCVAYCGCLTPAFADCDDTEAGTHPEARDRWGDGVDQDCSGHDGTDADGDGAASTESGGTDCDD